MLIDLYMFMNNFIYTAAVTSASLLNPSGDIATLTKPLKDRTHVQGPHKSQERKVLVETLFCCVLIFHCFTLDFNEVLVALTVTSVYLTSE